MEKFEDASSVKATSDFMAERMLDEKDGEEFTREYLKARFLSSVGRSLYYARRKAGLTQAQVAERMNTTQSVIARYEKDKKGSITFHRYMDFAIACGMMPRSLTIHPILEPTNSLRDEIIAQADLQSSQASFPEVQRIIVQALTVDSIQVPLVSNLAWSVAPVSFTNQDEGDAIEAAQKIMKQSQLRYCENVATTSANSQKPKSDQLTINNERRVFV